MQWHSQRGNSVQKQEEGKGSRKKSSWKVGIYAKKFVKSYWIVQYEMQGIKKVNFWLTYIFLLKLGFWGDAVILVTKHAKNIITYSFCQISVFSSHMIDFDIKKERTKEFISFDTFCYIKVCEAENWDQKSIFQS